MLQLPQTPNLLCTDPAYSSNRKFPSSAAQTRFDTYKPSNSNNSSRARKCACRISSPRANKDLALLARASTGNVLLDDVRLRVLDVLGALVLVLEEFHAPVVFPVRDVGDFLDEEDSLSLGLSDLKLGEYGLHDPKLLRVDVFVELLDENRIIDGQIERLRQKIEHVLIFQRILLHHFLLEFLDILRQIVLPRQLVMIPEMVHKLIRRQMHVIHFLGNPLFIRPQNVPIQFRVGFFPLASQKCGFDRV